MRLSNVVKKEVVKKVVYDELFKKFNAIQTTDAGDSIKKADYNTKVDEIEKKLLTMINVLLLKNLIS